MSTYTRILALSAADIAKSAQKPDRAPGRFRRSQAAAQQELVVHEGKSQTNDKTPFPTAILYIRSNGGRPREKQNTHPRFT